MNGTAGNTNYNLQYTQLTVKDFPVPMRPGRQPNFDKDGIAESVLRANVHQKVNDRLGLLLCITIQQVQGRRWCIRFTDEKDYTIRSENNLAGIGCRLQWRKVKLHLITITARRSVFTLDDSGYVGGFSKYSRGEYNGKAHFAEVYTNITRFQEKWMLAGIDYRMQQTDQDYLSVSSFGPYKSTLGDSAKVNQLGAYASVIVKNINGFNIEAEHALTILINMAMRLLFF